MAIVALAVGATLLGVTFGVPKGSGAFYTAGFALAATWVVAYALVPSRLRPERHRLLHFALGVAVGAVMFGVFVVGAWVLGRINVFDHAVDEVLSTADSSAMGWVVALAGINAVAEELFFRGTLIDAVPRRWAAAAGVIPYTLATVPSGNLALVVAAAVMGAVFTALRLRTGALLASITTHLSWSLLMLLLFPR